jgi:epoxyqueuosine reductase
MKAWEMMAADSLETRIKRMASDLGFDLAGICKPDPPPHFQSYLDWVEKGYHAGMEYLAREHSRSARVDPKLILPECESILVLGICYLPQDVSLIQQEQWSISAYAAGNDYHQIIKGKMNVLVSQIKDEIGSEFPYRIYTDTGPILEREYAQMAGLGWTGKNSCLINPQLGSYLFLGEILLGFPLKADRPFETDYCGSCSACVDSCPTACILPDRTLDANRCISYLTIEHRGSIPFEQHEKIDGWIFGCDVCQKVCPWNKRFAQPTNEQDFQVRSDYEEFDLLQFLSLDEVSFKQVFQASPIQRARLEGFLRNAMIAAGNHPDEQYIPLLHRLLQQTWSTPLRQHAAWSLSSFSAPSAQKILQETLDSTKDPVISQSISEALDAWKSKFSG